MATSVFIGSSSSSSDFDSPRKEMEMSLMNGSVQKPTRIHTGKPIGGGRRKSKPKESQKKEKIAKRGMGVEKLERLSFQARIKKMTEINPLHPLSFPNQHFTTLQTNPAFGAYSFLNGGVSSGGDVVALVGCDPQQSALYMFQGLRNGGVVHNHGPVVISSDQRFLADPFGVGSGFLGGYGTETSKELTSIPNNLKWNSEQCGICFKKPRGNGENLNGGNPYCSKPTGQEVEVMAGHRKGINTAAGGGGEGSRLMEYQFFPGKVGGNFGNNKEVLINMASSKEISFDDQDFVNGFGEGTAAAAAADSNSIDLSLKLSY